MIRLLKNILKLCAWSCRVLGCVPVVFTVSVSSLFSIPHLVFELPVALTIPPSCLARL